MAQVQVFTNGKWVGAGSQTVDKSNFVDVILLSAAVEGQTGNSNTWNNTNLGMNSQDIGFYLTGPGSTNVLAITPASIVSKYTATAPFLMHPVRGNLSSFPDGTTVAAYLLMCPNTTAYSAGDSNMVFGIVIPTDTVNADTKISMTWELPARGQISDYTSGALPLNPPYSYTFDMLRMSGVNISSRNYSGNLSGLTIFGVTWGMVKEAMGLKAAAITANFFGYTGNWKAHQVHFCKTSMA